MVKIQAVSKKSIGNGVEMPVLGLGTWKLRGNSGKDAVLSALEAGYRHIDTASMYDNEEIVGAAIRESNISREEVFITSKMWSDEKNDPEAALKRSLQRLGTDYLDLYLIHWPSGNDLKTWHEFEGLYNRNLCRAIGVSNFDYDLLKDSIVSQCNVKPMVNQIEMHPGEYDPQLLRYSEKESIVVTAYSPLGRAAQFSSDAITKIAEAHNKTPAQIMLRWSLEHGAVVIPKASKSEHQKQNMEIFNFSLSKEEIQLLDQL